MKKYTLIVLFFSIHVFGQAQDFITRWDLSIPGSGATQLSVGAGTVGTCSYTWETIPAGATGVGTFSGNMITITGLPVGAMIRLKIDTTNFRRININNGLDKKRLTDVEQWGGVHWNSMQTAFYGCTNLNCTATDIPDLSWVADMSSMFDSCIVLNSPANIGTWNTTNVTNMKGIFRDATAFNQAIGNWNTGSVTNMADMFNGAILFNVPIGNWNTANVTTMDSTFNGATSFNQALDWNTANVTTMAGMFEYATAFNQTIGNFNTGNVTNMLDMFKHASTFNQPIGNWNTGSVTNMWAMFNYASSFNQPIGNWNTGIVETMGAMFGGAIAFDQPIGNWNTSNVSDMGNMFSWGSVFNQPIGNWNTANVNDMGFMFYYNTAFNQPIGNWNTGNVKVMMYMFMGASSFNHPIGTWQLKTNVTMSFMLDSCGMDCNVYSATLNGWANNANTPLNRNVSANDLKFHLAGQIDRNYLINNKGWIISGDALDNNCCITSSYTFNDTACFTYFFNGQTLTNNGTYYDTLINANGCDSVITLNLLFNPPNITVSQTGALLTANAAGVSYQWLKCEPYAVINGATNQSYAATSNGTYAVIITQHGCTDTSACIQVMGIGLSDQHFSNNINIFPNPVNQILQIEFEHILQNASIKVLTITGLAVAEYNDISTNKFSIDMSSLSSGTYLIQIRGAGYSYVKRIHKGNQ